MSNSPAVMPDGTFFPFWDDKTEYHRIYHVACENPASSDDNPGSETQPFATINYAARLLQPGEKVIVHQGIYRECVRPRIGGNGPDGMIAYEAAKGETVIVRGSECWAPRFTRGEGWSYGDAPVWVADLPAEWFVGYNPFVARNFSSEYTTFTSDWRKDETERLLLRRGAVYLDGQPLKQVYFPQELSDEDGVFWVEEPGLRLHLRLRGDADPNGKSFEVTAREQIFAPTTPGLGYIRVSGFHLEYAADGVPVPQRALLSAGRGHHWIIEDNAIARANSTGIDVGNETWHRLEGRGGPSGCHIIRRNRISDCGICGIAAVGNNACSLVEDNLIEHIGGMNLERIWESGGLKFHTCDTVLIRHNVFRHICYAPGLWLDYLNKNSRITANIFHDIASLNGCIFIEVSHAPNLVDHNILWDIRGAGPEKWQGHFGPGINIDTGEECIVAHNLLGKVRDEYAIMVHLPQKERVVDGRFGLCRQHKVLNNLIVDCPRRILISRSEDNVIDGNLFDEEDDFTSLCVEYPAPRAVLNLEAWQKYFGFDLHGGQTRMDADFDPETLKLTLEVKGECPRSVRVAQLYSEWQEGTPGPVKVKPGRNCFLFQNNTEQFGFLVSS